ncbi:alpha/beta fold hydrolase [Streptomyces sp. NPDC058665]|uniref:alpha/beta fold hydrolase n=1 Tax=Streptomyces sp. NPDC058665 TaxID=3346586 RepID=UPI0036695829
MTVADLFNLPTPALLATTFEEGAGARAASTMLPLRTGGDEPPLFCVHPAGGFGWCYSGVPRMLGSGRPVHAFQARGLDVSTDAMLPGTLTEMAADYLDRAREVQPQGPLHLLGWSMGGVVAHAMAVEAQRRGEEVGALIMLDSYPVLDDEASAAVGDFAEVERVMAEAAGPDFTVGRLISPVDDAADQKRAEAVVRGVVTNNLQLLSLHRPETFHGDALLIRAALDPVPVGRAPEQDWEPYVTGELSVMSMPSTHGELMAVEHSETLGELLRHWLDRRG